MQWADDVALVQSYLVVPSLSDAQVAALLEAEAADAAAEEAASAATAAVPLRLVDYDDDEDEDDVHETLSPLQRAGRAEHERMRGGVLEGVPHEQQHGSDV